MAIRVTQGVGQQAGQEAAERSQRMLALKPKTVIERMIDEGPPSLAQQPIQVESKEANIRDMAAKAAVGVVWLFRPGFVSGCFGQHVLDMRREVETERERDR